MLNSKQMRVRDLFKGRRAIAHIEQLCAFGDRFVGTPGDAAAFEYVRSQFAALGLEVSLSPIRVPGFVDGGGSLSLAGRTFDAIPAYYSPSTPPEGITAPDSLCRDRRSRGLRRAGCEGEDRPHPGARSGLRPLLAGNVRGRGGSAWRRGDDRGPPDAVGRTGCPWRRATPA